ncbi:hypothetical protein [Undibacterium sp. TJN19]|uniref:hypothetical protein n=1 Tax=Undibacterium sp. TJN19 TaxID=3413055 RepID=UPI003BF4CC1F
MLFDWSWFMSVDFRGKWLITTGRAFLAVADESYAVSGVMCLRDECNQDTVVYARFSGMVSEDSRVSMTITSEKEGVPSFEVFGTMHSQ